MSQPSTLPMAHNIITRIDWLPEICSNNNPGLKRPFGARRGNFAVTTVKTRVAFAQEKVKNSAGWLYLCSYWAMSRILLKLAERSLPSMLLRDFQLFVKIPVMQLI